MAYQAKQREILPPPPQPILETPTDELVGKRLANSYTNLKHYFVASERFERQSQLRITPITLLPPPASPRQRTVSPSGHLLSPVPPPAVINAGGTRTMSLRSQLPSKAESELNAAAYRKSSLSSDMAQEGGVAREQERLQALSDINSAVSSAPPSMPNRGPGKRDRSQSFPVEQQDDGFVAKRANYESAPSPATSHYINSPRTGAPSFATPSSATDPLAPMPLPFQPPPSPANQQLQLSMQQQAQMRQHQMAAAAAQQQQTMLAQQVIAQRQAQAERQRQTSAESPRLTNAMPILRRPGSALGHTSYSASSPPNAGSPSTQQSAPLHVDGRSLAEQYSSIQVTINAPNFLSHPIILQQQLQMNAQRLLYRIQAEAAMNTRSTQVATPVLRAGSPMGIAAASPRHMSSPQLPQPQNQARRNSGYAGSTTSHAGSPSASGTAGGTPQAESSSSFFREQYVSKSLSDEYRRYADVAFVDWLNKRSRCVPSRPLRYLNNRTKIILHNIRIILLSPRRTALDPRRTLLDLHNLNQARPRITLRNISKSIKVSHPLSSIHRLECRLVYSVDSR